MHKRFQWEPSSSWGIGVFLQASREGTSWPWRLLQMLEVSRFTYIFWEAKVKNAIVSRRYKVECQFETFEGLEKIETWFFNYFSDKCLFYQTHSSCNGIGKFRELHEINHFTTGYPNMLFGMTDERMVKKSE